MINSYKNSLPFVENIYTTYKNRQMLSDVVIMRIALIFLLIGTHSFAPYCGSWEAIPNAPLGGPYGYISRFTHYISMPALIFLSGYLFGHSWNKTSQQDWKSFIIKKFKRLIIPSIVFSVFYYFLFYETDAPISDIFYSIVNGCGHLWFLPMLFWCFIICYIVNKLNINPKIVIAILSIVAVIPIPTLPFRLSSVCTYLIFFYIGSHLQTGKGIQLSASWLRLYAFGLAYCALQYLLVIANVVATSTALKIVSLIGINTLKLLLGSTGIALAYTATRLFLANNKQLPQTIVLLSTYCYGVYIFQQFILKYYYYHTTASQLITTTLVPWIGFSITLIISVALSALLLRTRVGRYLIG